jgi:hypothetical protein
VVLAAYVEGTMSAQFKDREEMADCAADLVKRRANTKKHARLRKLGIAGRHSLVHWALRRLLHPAPADPLTLLTKQQRERMQRRPKPVANISFHAPAESPYCSSSPTSFCAGVISASSPSSNLTIRRMHSCTVRMPMRGRRRRSNRPG